MTELMQLIIERIQREGPISFATYMQMALYEPGNGYYVSGTHKMGWEEKDYFTSTDISTLFASCLGQQLQRMWEQLKQPQLFTILEQGAGRGHLARDIQAWAEKESPEFHAALDYRLADIRVGQDARGPTTNASATSTNHQDDIVPSVILSNELIDAFPVHVVEKRGERLYEIYVDVRDMGDRQHERLAETLREQRDQAFEDYLDRYRVPWRGYSDGWRAEINLDALRWMEIAASKLRRGFVLTIDYGDKARALYTRERREGTLLCYSYHRFNDRPLLRPGEQDITAHVNFSALIEVGRRHGLRLNAFTTQQAWLQSLGIYDELERLRARDYAASVTNRASDAGQVALLRWYSLRQGVTTLMDPAGMGNFKVLVMRR
jgi:SAM-dependent MidA family methyltransferase